MVSSAVPSPQSTVDPQLLLWAQPSRLGPEVVPTKLAFMVPREQVLLYALVFSFAPERALEIGVLHGGSARIIHAALADLDRGHLVALDPAPDLRIDWDAIRDRSTLIVGRSPEDLPRARDVAGGPFDFVLLDGDHSREGAWRDLQGIASVTQPGACVLAHDACHPEVAKALDMAVRGELPYRDGGIVSRTPNPENDGSAAAPWGGLRLLRRV